MLWIIAILIFGTVDICIDFLMQRYCIKKCNFDCSKCRNWRCYKHWCDKKRSEMIERNSNTFDR